MFFLLLIAYGVVLLAVLVFQRRLIYLPTRIPPEVVKSVAAEHGFVPWTNAAGGGIGWKMAANGEAEANVLIVHGNAGCALSRDYIAQPIHAASRVSVYVLEYPGYGARPGRPTKTALIAAAEEAWQCLPAHAPRFVVSESIGAGVAAELARRHPQEIAGLALLVPYHDLPGVAQRQMPFLPAYFLLFDRFNPAECLKSYAGPVLIAVAGEDEIIGADSGRRLYASYGGPKRLVEFPGAGHNDVAAQPPDWWGTVFAFWHQPAKP